MGSIATLRVDIVCDDCGEPLAKNQHVGGVDDLPSVYGLLEDALESISVYTMHGESFCSECYQERERELEEAENEPTGHQIFLNF